MAIQFVNNLDINKNYLEQAAIENLASNPSAPVTGQVYFNTTDSNLKIYDGGQWDGFVNEILTSDGTFINLTPNAGSTGHVTIGADLSAAGTPSSSTFLRGDNQWASIPGGYTKWQYQANGGTAIDMVDSEILNFVQGTGISLAAAAASPNTLTVTNSKPFDNITLAASSGSNSSITNQGTITIAAGSNISTTNNGSGQVTIAYTGGTGSMSSFTLAADTGTSQTIQDGDTLSILGSTGIDTVVGATDTVTVNLDLSELTTVTTIDPAADFLVGVDGTANEKILYQNVHVNQWGDAEGVVNMGSSGSENRIKHLQAGSDATDAVNVAQLEAAVAGVGLFQGGYNANTGLTTDLSTNGSLDGASNIALDKGDFFVVTTAGSAFYSETLEVGDMIYANQDITASSNPAQSVYTVVIADENIAGSGTTDGGTQKGVAGFNSAHFNVTANGWVSSDIYGGGSTLGIVPSGGAADTFLRGDGSWQIPTNTQYTADQGVDLNGTVFRADLISYTAQTVAANTASTTTSRTYPIQINSSDKLVVNVPWTDTNTQTVTSVDESTANDELGIIVSPTTGNVKVGLDIKGTANLGATPASNDEIIIYDTSADTNKALTIANLQAAIDTSAGKRIVLNSGLAYVSKADSGGVRTFTVNVANASVFGAGSTAINVKCEVITAAGATVYADVTRSSADLDIAFVGTPADSAYEVLLTYVG